MKKEVLGTILRIIACIVIVLFVVFITRHVDVLFVIPITIIAQTVWVFFLMFLEGKGL